MSTPAKRTAKEISDTFITEIEAQLSQTIPLLPRAFVRLWAKMLGIVFVVIFQWSEFIAMQLYVKYASDKPITIGGITYTPLDVWGNQIGLEKDLGVRTEGTITIDVLSTGDTLLSGTKLLDSNTGELYLTIGDIDLDASTVTGTVRSVNYSALATLSVDQVLSFVSAPTTIEKDVTVATVTSQGADAETSEEWRQRQLDWWAARPQGGAYADYRLWGQEVSGVENIYPFSGGTPAIPTSGEGQVDIYVEADDTTDGIAPQALLDAVKANIEQTADTGLADRRPLNTYVNVASIYRATFDVTITGLTVTDETSAKTAIETAIEQYMANRENFISGLSRLPRKDIVSSPELAGVVGRVVASYGGVITSAVIDGITSYILVEGQKAKLGTITWN